jgi:Spy/CpxP family protein refolding chaperone
MKPHAIILAALTLIASLAFAEPPPKPKGPPPGGRGGPSQESAEMKALLESFHLTPEQRAKYDAAKAETGKKMREIHEGKVNGTLPQDEVLKQALASHKAFNAAVKSILTPEQYEKWLPLREADHHKIAQAHKERDEAAAKSGAEKKP